SRRAMEVDGNGPFGYYAVGTTAAGPLGHRDGQHMGMPIGQMSGCSMMTPPAAKPADAVAGANGGLTTTQGAPDKVAPPKATTTSAKDAVAGANGGPTSANAAGGVAALGGGGDIAAVLQQLIEKITALIAQLTGGAVAGANGGPTQSEPAKGP